MSPSSLPDEALPPGLTELIARPFAHRGLHGGGRLENSRAAFAAAIDRGFGIELDVQASLDGEAMVFHDYELDRLTPEKGRVAARTAAELGGIPLRSTTETIPTLAEILRLIGGRTPLLIEAKSPDRNIERLCRSIASDLRDYDGPVAVMSFNPEVGRWFALNANHVLRGLVVTEENKRGWRGDLERRFALRRASPHLLAYDVRDFPSRFAARVRQRSIPVLTWTVRSDGDRARAAEHADQIIHELPGLP